MCSPDRCEVLRKVRLANRRMWESSNTLDSDNLQRALRPTAADRERLVDCEYESAVRRRWNCAAGRGLPTGEQRDVMSRVKTSQAHRHPPQARR